MTISKEARTSVFTTGVVNRIAGKRVVAMTKRTPLTLPGLRVKQWLIESYSLMTKDRLSLVYLKVRRSI